MFTRDPNPHPGPLPAPATSTRETRPATFRHTHRVRTLFQAKNSRTFQGLSRTLTRNFKDVFYLKTKKNVFVKIYVLGLQIVQNIFDLVQ